MFWKLSKLRHVRNWILCAWLSIMVTMHICITLKFSKRYFFEGGRWMLITLILFNVKIKAYSVTYKILSSIGSWIPFKFWAKQSTFMQGCKRLRYNFNSYLHSKFSSFSSFSIWDTPGGTPSSVHRDHSYGLGDHMWWIATEPKSNMGKASTLLWPPNLIFYTLFLWLNIKKMAQPQLWVCAIFFNWHYSQ